MNRPDPLNLRLRAWKRHQDPASPPDREADELLADYEDWAVRLWVWAVRFFILGMIGGIWWVAR